MQGDHLLSVAGVSEQAGWARARARRGQNTHRDGARRRARANRGVHREDGLSAKSRSFSFLFFFKIQSVSQTRRKSVDAG